MKKRRFLRKLLRPRMLIIYILVILIAVLILTYAFGGVKAKTDNFTPLYARYKKILYQ